MKNPKKFNSFTKSIEYPNLNHAFDSGKAITLISFKSIKTILNPETNKSCYCSP